MAYNSGVAAGTPLADLIFCIGASCIFGEIERQLAAVNLQNFVPGHDASEFWGEDLTASLDCNGNVNASHVAYVDDVAYPGMAHSSMVIDKIASCMTIIVNTVSAFLFEANLDAGKTEVTLRLAGPGINAVKQRILDEWRTIAFPTHHGLRRVNVVDKYVHLGMSTNASCTRQPEISARKRSSMDALGPIATKCFKVESIPLAHKVSITWSHIFSRLLFGAGSWGILNKQETSSLSSAVMHSWRRATCTTYKQREEQSLPPISDGTVLQRYELMAPLTMVRLLRFNLLVRVACSNNVILKVTVHAAMASPKSWIAAVQQDFEWMRNLASDTGSDAFDDVDNITKLITDIRLRPLYWKKVIKALCSTKQANLLQEHPECQDTENGPAIACQLCRYVCFTPSQLAVHKFSRHGIIKEARMFLDDSNMCPSCFRRFPSRTQALKHMSVSKRCAGYAEFTDVLETKIVNALDIAEDERLKGTRSSGTHDTCQISHLQTLQGPFRKQHAACFKSRPRYKVVDSTFTNCQADHFAPCDGRCILCGGEGVT